MGDAITVHLLSERNLQLISDHLRTKFTSSKREVSIETYGFGGLEQQSFAVHKAVVNAQIDPSTEHLVVVAFSDEHMLSVDQSESLSARHMEMLAERLSNALSLFSAMSNVKLLLVNTSSDDGFFSNARIQLEQHDVFLNNRCDLIRGAMLNVTCILHDAHYLGLHDKVFGSREVDLSSVRHVHFKFLVAQFEEWLSSALEGFLRRHYFSPLIKCLVFDLDNTMWRGIVGDDGVENLSFDGDTIACLHGLLNMANSVGLFTAVISKNDPDIVREALSDARFRLSEGDFDIVLANWDSKAENMSRVLAMLNIHPESLGFLDDNPKELLAVATHFPDVHQIKVDLDDDEKLFNDASSLWELMRPTTVTAEDHKRKRSLTSKVAFDKMKHKTDDLEKINEALETKIRKIDFSDCSERAVQLVKKTNQFSSGFPFEHDSIPSEPQSSFGFGVEVSDRYANLGVVAVVIGHQQKTGHVSINHFALSCRAFDRGVEDFVLSTLENQFPSGDLTFEWRDTGRNKSFQKFLLKFANRISADQR